MRMITRVALVAASVAVIGVVASPAVAKNTAEYWNFPDAPLTKTGYGSTVKGSGYQKIATGTNGTRIYVTTFHKFTDGDNHAAYLTGVTQFNAGYCRTDTNTMVYNNVEVSSSSSCVLQFFDLSNYRQKGVNYTATAWVKMPDDNFPVNVNADRGRVVVRMGIDVPLRTDPVSGQAVSPAESF